MSAAESVAQDLDGKIALVTGGGRGVGAATSKELARHAAHVIVNWCHFGEAAEATVAEIRASGGSARAVRASVAKPETVNALFDDIARTEGKLDVLVNNAAWGIFAPSQALSERDWLRALDTNVHATRRCSLRAAELLAAADGGAIVNVSSIGAGFAVDNYMVVGVCKAAVEALTRYLAADLGPRGIRVNTASAGMLDNPTASRFPDADGLRATCEAATPLGRIGREEDLARLVAFLASPQADWITGQCYIADGGLSVGRALLTPHPAGTWKSHPARPDAAEAATDPNTP
ncbi:SDR family oxidoreductase [Streptomyces sp. AK02-04a]|uniref:SDR family oxidoreductase n=1 Tax=Streptomyces sp. AK02-04a TaxID=3028649 RepID=UPI0029A2CAD8|nr:SDR family oxidoreductase [Streptomyces sp. AK02-04a]MDX3763519.1 SDR family oxidoreductase [Streptomyces sp. AK02-04a]